MKQRPMIVSYILLIWFAISFITNLIGPLMRVAAGEEHFAFFSVMA
ncbi:MAG: hypothetical protein JF591_14065, partial [Lysobacter sp.]|nr:hypothetical protein [Lysobacter sp.]